ncbi:hypothetical protein [Paenibacillus sp. YN15]|uniref:hypothetical protein n=1 Tax=Paenibacillus sp. YN15 TaxID=1742774 RepID=UPI000DCEAFA1|nr:hypothetical protein [Paenibacillus sp. YN15]RAU96809.1 hypothetical protein DQG13_19835 [Paenibacillus sp. YN15]
MSADKAKVIAEVKRAIERLDSVISRIDNGDMGFSEAGDWLHNCGDTVVSALESALDAIKEAD